jgi:hypothetical protein
VRELAKEHQDKLQEHKKMVEDWQQYFQENNDRYWDFTKFVCSTGLTAPDIAALNTLGKPTVEFNILEAMVSRLRSDFAKQQPSFDVRAADGVPLEMLTPEFIETEQVVEGYLRAIFNDATNDGLQSNINSDQLIGGFSVVWVRTDYVSERSFEQNIIVERVFDPTMTFFDPLARTSHKGDGGYCGMLIPYTKDRFIQEYGAEAAKDINFTRGSNIEGFSWSYKNQEQDVVLVAYLFEKKFKKIKLVNLSNGHVVPMSQYKKLLELWDDITQPPIVLEERWTNEETICHYQFCETKELHYSETNYKFLPLVFVDGNSVLIRGDVTSAATGSGNDSASGSTMQMTRPYVFHAKDAQRCMNFAGQSVMQSIENIVQYQIMVPAEAIPEEYLGAYQKPQEANVLVYNQFDDKTGQRLDPPREVQKVPPPPVVESTFQNSTRIIQSTLGSYDAQQGIVGDNLSGRAIMQGAMQSDGAAGPYLINYIKAWNRIGQIVLDLIPKYYVTPRSIPVMDKDGKRRFQVVNGPKNEEHEAAQNAEQRQQDEMGRNAQEKDEQRSVSLDYDPLSLQIKVDAGVNSEVQKQISMDMIIRSMQANPDFANFMTTMGLEVFIDNMNIRNADTLKMLGAKYMKQKEEMQQMAMEQEEAEPSEMEIIQEIELAKVQQRAEQAQGELAIKAANVAVDKEKNEIEYARLLAEIQDGHRKAQMEVAKEAAAGSKEAVEMAIEVAKWQHEQFSDKQE